MNPDRTLSPIPPPLVLPLLFIAALLLLPAVVQADVIQARQWNITADKMTRYENPPSIIAEGNVVLEKTEEVVREKKDDESKWDALLEEEPDEDEQPPVTVTETRTLTTIKADWIAYDVNMGTIKARGNLIIDLGPDRLTAETGEVNLNDETGMFTEAAIIREHKDLHLEGRVIEKTGDMTYRIQDGWVITCKLKEGQTAPWSFASRDADITDGGYALLKHATFRIKDVPVLYTPFMVLPVKRERQTGFLFPAISSSDRDGLGLALPFYLSLSPSSDLTVYPEFMAERGLMAGLEFRYVLEQDSKGTLMANYLHDSLTDPSEVEYYRDGNYTHTNKDRYWVRGKVDQEINGWITRLDLDIVSDRDYLTEFTSGLTGFNTSNERFLDVFGRGFEYKTIDERKNTLRVVKYWQDMALEGEVLGINDVRETKFSPTPLWKLPAFNFTGLLPLKETRINFDWDANYVNYWREDGLGAHRVDLYPRLTAPIPLSEYLETTAEVGLRNTSYVVQEYGDEWEYDDTFENRFVPDFQTEIGTTLVRDFGVRMGSINTLSHTFRPFVNYLYVPDVDQDDLPQLDDIDTIFDRNLITYGLDNFFKVSGKLLGRDYDRNYGSIKITHGYDLRSEESDTPFEPVNVEISYQPLTNLNIRYDTDIDTYGDGVLTYRVMGGYRNSRGDFLSADYRYYKLFDINSVSANARVNLFYRLVAGYTIERSIADSKTVEENIALIYQQPCWSVELSSHYTPGDRKFMMIFRLANIGNPLGIDLPGF
ncbi:MAG: LPS assembly protein LptD [Desulfobulbaceae bacterium]|nr:LPS assembly protein LptD [Desulfobulbaceae bacterium]